MAEISQQPKILPLTFDSSEISSILEDKKEYKKDKITISLLKGGKKIKRYLFQNSDDTLPFIGVVNGSLKRNGYCVNKYENGDTYFGHYKKDLKDKNGLYSYNPIVDGKFRLSEYYFGSYENDLKNGNGIYLWIKERESKKEFANYKRASFSVFIGNFKDDNLDKGVLFQRKIKKVGEDLLFYYGSLNSERLKHGENSFFYSYELGILYFGKYKNDKFINGFIGKLDENDNIIDMAHYYKKKSHPKETISSEDFKKYSEIMNDFLKIIKSRNYFKEMYDIFSEVNEFKEVYKSQIDTYNKDKEKMNEVENTLNKYNSITICEDIENLIKNKNLNNENTNE